jgi:hypothetical protein
VRTASPAEALEEERRRVCDVGARAGAAEEVAVTRTSGGWRDALGRESAAAPAPRAGERGGSGEDLKGRRSWCAKVGLSVKRAGSVKRDACLPESPLDAGALRETPVVRWSAWTDVARSHVERE